MRYKVQLDKNIIENKEKNRLWQIYLHTEDGEIYQEYCMMRNQVRRLPRQKQSKIKKNIAREIEQKPKKFWSYVSSKTKK